jgi:hypothetical protein
LLIGKMIISNATRKRCAIISGSVGRLGISAKLKYIRARKKPFTATTSVCATNVVSVPLIPINSSRSSIR